MHVRSRQRSGRMLYLRNVWRGGRAVDGGCLENSRAKAPGVRIPPSPSGQHRGRCQRGRMGPPAKRLRGLKSPSRVRIPPFPPRQARRRLAACGALASEVPTEAPYVALSRQRLRVRSPSLPPSDLQTVCASNPPRRRGRATPAHGSETRAILLDAP